MAFRIEDLTEQFMTGLLTGYRRDLHRIPEIGFDLPETAAYVAEVIKDMYCEITQPAENGFALYFDMGRAETTAFRGDMDALPMTEMNDVEYKSVHEGKMHACGHDGHNTLMLGLAQYVNAVKAGIKAGTCEPLPTNILIIFQPAEEFDGGGRAVCESGVLEKYNVKRAFSAHLWPGFAEGTLNCRPGVQMSKSKTITVDVHGRSAHAQSPEKAVDSLLIASRLVCALDEMKREVIKKDRMLLQMCIFESGAASNIIPDRAHLRGTLRTFDNGLFDSVVERIAAICAAFDKEYGCRTEVSYNIGYPCVVNDAELIEEVKAKLPEFSYGEVAEPVYGSDDFAYFGERVPSVYWYLGVGNGTLHTNTFNFDERVLWTGYSFFRRLAETEWQSGQ